MVWSVWVLFPWPDIKPMSPAVEVHNLSYWTTQYMDSCSSIFFECEQLTVICFIFSSVLCAQSDKRDVGKISGNHDKCRNGACFLLIRENSWFTALSLENECHQNVPLFLTYCDHEFLHKIYINIFFQRRMRCNIWMAKENSFLIFECFLDVSQWLRLSYRILGKFLQQKCT